MRSAIATRPPGLSPLAVAGIAVVMLLAGVVASLAIRAPGSGGRAAEAGEGLDRIRWKVPVAFATTLAALGDTPLYLSETLSEASAGAVDLEVFEPGKLVPPLSITDAVKDRKIEAGYTWLGYDQGKVPSSPLFSAVPFGMEPWEFTAWWYEGGGDALAQEVYGPHGVHAILCGMTGPETAGWFRNEIETTGDIRGLKIRFAGLGGRVMQNLGASVTVLPGGEIFPALEKGAIDATEFSLPNVDQALGFNKIVKVNHFPGWHQPFTAFHLVINNQVWDALSAPSRAILETGCTAAVLRNLAKGEAIQGAVLRTYESKGVTAVSLPEPVLREIQVAAEQVLAEEAARDPLFKKVYESQQAFLADYRPWKRLGYLPRDF
jgi:TRAP-type mannitol/chloroaromatic compound transport system substrate-binding protein